MALAVTEEHQALAESVRGWAERNAGPEAVRAAVDASDSGAARYAESVHGALAAQGLLGLHLPERQGGQGFGLRCRVIIGKWCWFHRSAGPPF